jgi:hypothetical protein
MLTPVAVILELFPDTPPGYELFCPSYPAAPPAPTVIVKVCTVLVVILPVWTLPPPPPPPMVSPPPPPPPTTRYSRFKLFGFAETTKLPEFVKV